MWSHGKQVTNKAPVNPLPPNTFRFGIDSLQVHPGPCGVVVCRAGSRGGSQHPERVLDGWRARECRPSELPASPSPSSTAAATFTSYLFIHFFPFVFIIPSRGDI
ncbi:no significant blast hit [Histoplasma capsulatum var. duboisii H88]|uniref:No significant blast hit n=1 Tax=Ajellomyces capsulatus (strain H88) TaxID=544711 RepID=A0A8A1L8H7_AJEC8|nr:no significant blast hit [Histoplasma capsulatum var. duboisii H88]